MSALFQWLTSLQHIKVGAGFFLAVLAIFLLRYVLDAVRSSLRRRETTQLLHEASILEDEVRLVSRERSLARLENMILQEILRQGELSKALDALLRRFVPNPQAAFAAFFSLDRDELRLTQTRGLSDESIAAMHLDPATVKVLSVQQVIRLRDDMLRRHPVYHLLAAKDRAKTRELYLIGIGEAHHIVSVLVTTQLIPVAAPFEERLELTQRLASGISGNVQQSLALQRQCTELRSTRDMLELRSIADDQFDQPVRLIERFIGRLAQLTGCERAALFLVRREPEIDPRPLIRAGVQLPPHLQSVWERHEELLAGCSTTQLVPTWYDQRGLEQYSIETLMRSAIVSPLILDNQPMGLLILSRRDRAECDQVHRELVTWASQTLAQTINRVLSFVNIERQAKQDGLTELANRRTFDAQFQAEMDAVTLGRQTECSLVLIDLDHFKSINDQHGHQAGDEVLRDTARVLRQQVGQLRNSDRPLLARYGGEEIALILPAIGVNGACRIAESLRAALEAHVFTHAGKTIPVTASFGVSTAPLHARSTNDLLAAADSALYRAKQSGRNCVCLPEDEVLAPVEPARRANFAGALNG